MPRPYEYPPARAPAAPPHALDFSLSLFSMHGRPIGKYWKPIPPIPATHFVAADWGWDDSTGLILNREHGRFFSSQQVKEWTRQNLKKAMMDTHHTVNRFALGLPAQRDEAWTAARKRWGYDVELWWDESTSSYRKFLSHDPARLPQ